MKTIKTNIVIKTFNGENVKKSEKDDLQIGEAISNVLGMAQSNPSLAWQFGKKFATEESVDLKAEDVVYLKKELETSKVYNAMILGQIIEILEAKDEK